MMNHSIYNGLVPQTKRSISVLELAQLLYLECMSRWWPAVHEQPNSEMHLHMIICFIDSCWMPNSIIMCQSTGYSAVLAS